MKRCSMEENISVQFVNKIYDMTHEIFPERIVSKARECFIDYLAVLLGGSKENNAKNTLFFKENHFPGDFYVIGMTEKTDLKTAVMINAFNAHTLELDDSHRRAMTHLGASIFSALIGVAQMYCCSLDGLFHAAIVGYEAAIRLGNAIQPGHKKRGFHVSGTCCTVGCAMGVASMLDYSREEMFNALCAAATTAAGLLGIISGQSEQKPYNVANAAVAGLNAALYGKYFHGAEDILCDSRGFFEVMSESARPDIMFEEGYAIEGIYQKLYAACRHCHAPMEAMLSLRKNYNFQPEDIDRVMVATYDLAIQGHDHKMITGVSSAKQSIPYCVAAACMYQECGIDVFDENNLSDENLLRFVEKIDVIEDPELSVLVPQKRAAKITIYLNDGKELCWRIDYPKGEPENPITHEELIDKFNFLAGIAGRDSDYCASVLNLIENNGTMKIGEFLRVMD